MNLARQVPYENNGGEINCNYLREKNVEEGEMNFGTGGYYFYIQFV